MVSVQRFGIQVEQAFHVEMHNYLVNGKTHIQTTAIRRSQRRWHR